MKRSGWWVLATLIALVGWWSRPGEAKRGQVDYRALNALRGACKNGKNVMPYVIEATREYATEQEMCDVYREVFGEYRDPGFY